RDLGTVVAHVLQDAGPVGVGAEQDAALLVRDEQAAPVVEAHVDQREDAAVVGALDELLDLVALWHGELAGRRRAALAGAAAAAPRADLAVRAEHLRPAPFRVVEVRLLPALRGLLRRLPRAVGDDVG